MASVSVGIGDSRRRPEENILLIVIKHFFRGLNRWRISAVTIHENNSATPSGRPHDFDQH